MKQKINYFVIFIFASFCLVSCKIAENAIKNADEFDKSMTELRGQVYQSVRDVKKSSSIDSETNNKLKIQYTAVQENFNKNFDKIINRVDSSKLDEAKCAVLNYKFVLAPHRGNFKNSSRLATEFNQKVLKEIGGAAIGSPDLVRLIEKIFEAVAKYRIKVCKGKLTDMKYKNWDDI